jgi:tyrosinase
MERYTTDRPFELPLWEGQPSFYRADLHFHGVEHRGDSYEGRVFLDAPDAGPATPMEPESGYAGSFYVFGHGPCYGDDGHCEVPQGPIHPFDYRRPHPLNPRLAVVTITDALQRRIAAGGSEFGVTVVPTNVRDEEVGDVLHFQRLSLITYD